MTCAGSMSSAFLLGPDRDASCPQQPVRAFELNGIGLLQISAAQVNLALGTVPISGSR